nr:PREDICTED: receptor activity-modifying protein 1 isoform X2 [Latimeria chalumnae]|eukprot:XP_014344722.1 PREDICTED: receptor activity-modifying protein 1 isoform X2 [Latimeria chalumnae]
MGLNLLAVSRNLLLWFFVAHHFIVVTACDEGMYTYTMEDLCLKKFKFEMQDLGQRYWCDWDLTISKMMEHSSWGTFTLPPSFLLYDHIGNHLFQICFSFFFFNLLYLLILLLYFGCYEALREPAVKY